MKKVLCFVMNIILILTPCLAFADGFCNDPDAIETAVQSVLMLEIYFNNSDYLQKARKYGHFTGYKN